MYGSKTQSVTDHDWGSVLGDFECAHDCNRGVDTTAECSCVMSHVRRLMNSSQHKHNESLGTTVIPPDFAVDVWNVTGLLSALDYAGSGMYQDFDKGNLTLTDDGSILKGLSTGDMHAFYQWTATFVSRFPQLGPMAATGASPSDPLFWAVHSAWERMWHHLRLKNLSNSTSDWNAFIGESGNSSGHTCAWSRHADSLLPWRNLTSMPTADADGYYTNAELMELFHPSSIELPFVFDTFDWGHCEGWDTKEGAFDTSLDETDMPVRQQRLARFVSAVRDLGGP
mmetsp:Transcript_71193/g.200183  ORF Transcript_71193/g.200183 Transcript_71193/m.200183 type:complete len:283 (-) Transcript_71193:46-894(-)